MVEKAGFSLKQRNPDVLTSIANLSNDEVFTPPSFANQMLDTIEKAWAKNNNGAIIWEDKDVTFLDPFTKSGVFLREITSRLSKGLQKQIPDDQERVNHILTKQVFGVAITELTALLARRSVYCSKHANGKHSICTEFDTPQGNIWFERTEHTWVGGKEKVITVDGNGNEAEVTTDGTCKFCRANQKAYARGAGSETHAYSLIHTDQPKQWTFQTFGVDMQFDVIVGNPPYQLDDGGYGTSAGPIYNLFVQQAINLRPKFLSMVIPARWFTGGKGLDRFREQMLTDQRLQIIHDYPDSSKIFPGVQIKNGICYFLWDRAASGPCEITNYFDDQVYGPVTRPLLEAGSQVLIRYNPAVEIVRKVMALENNQADNETEFRLPKGKQFALLVSARRPFGFDTTFLGRDRKADGDLKIHRNRGVGFVSRSEVKENINLVDAWKVYTPRASSGSDAFPHPILGTPFLGVPGSVSSETYLAIGPLASKTEAENIITYLKTRFCRFMALQNKSSQDATRSIYQLVPMQDFSKPWTDEELYAKYKLTQEEIDFIESMIRPMELEDA